MTWNAICGFVGFGDYNPTCAVQYSGTYAFKVPQKRPQNIVYAWQFQFSKMIWTFQFINLSICKWQKSVVWKELKNVLHGVLVYKTIKTVADLFSMDVMNSIKVWGILFHSLKIAISMSQTARHCASCNVSSKYDPDILNLIKQGANDILTNYGQKLNVITTVYFLVHYLKNFFSIGHGFPFLSILILLWLVFFPPLY